MADQADQNKTTGSPWEEVLDVDENEKPKIFGTLDSGASPTPPPGGQLKVPTEIRQGVGSKVPGEQVATSQEQPPATTISNVPPVTPIAPNTPLLASNPAPIPTTPVSAPIPSPQPPAQPRVGGISGLLKPKPTQAPAAGPAVPKANQVFTNRAAAPILSSQAPVAENKLPETPKTPRSANLAKPLQEWLAKPKVIIAAIVIVLVVGLTYFNETGVLSSGLEKVYGIFRLEALWGGLPADSQLALTQSFQKMQTEKSLKIDSEIKFTVNKSSESGVTKPLLSLKDPIYLFALDKAVLAASTTSSVITQDDLNADQPTATPSIDSATDLTATTDQTTQDVTTPTTSTSTTSSSTSSSSSSQTDQTGTTTITDNLTTIKEFSSTGKSYLSTDGATSQMEITDESGKKNDVSLMAQSGRLYVNSTGVDYQGSSKGWVYFPVLSSSSQEILPAIFSKPNLSGFSVTGKRIGSGKFNGEPVYRYQVNIKIGSLFENIGVTDEMVNSITGEIDISKKDQLIRYLELTITPSISSAITRFDIKMAISGYNSSESLTFPENATEAGSTTTTTTPTVTTPTTTIPTTTTPAATYPGVSADLLARDAQRKADLKSIELALTSYYATYQSYPNTSNLEIKTRTAGNILATSLVSNYMASLPVDPWTDKYYYGYKSDGATYELNALLGNSGDIDGTMIGGNNLFIIRH